MEKLDYMSKYQWNEEVVYKGERVTILGHLTDNQYMVKYPDGAIVSNVYESELSYE